MKTNQLIAKRIRLTKKRKLMHRMAGQNHFNAKESSKVTINKKVRRPMGKAYRQTILRSI